MSHPILKQIRHLAILPLACVFALISTSGIAQSGNGTDNLEWVEVPLPPPPQFSKDHLIPIDMPRHVTVKFGVDPSTIAVGSDGVVRYVMVMINATGSSNAVYEGIRCISDEVKTYARLNSSGQWVMVDAPTWKGVSENMPSRHAQAFARQGGCQKRLATSQQEIVAALKSAWRPSAPQKGN